MTPENFVYWLNGFFELTGETDLTPEQVKVIKEHLSLTLTKVTPSEIDPKVFANPADQKQIDFSTILNVPTIRTC